MIPSKTLQVITVPLKVMTVNIRYSGAKDGKHIWKNRRPLMKTLLTKYSPDIIGFQEVKLDQLENLHEDLPEYQYIGKGRDDGQHDGEHSAIFFRNMELLKEGTFWLSDSPDNPSKQWGGLPRICTWGHFRTQEGKEFAFYNTHLDNRLETNRTKGVELILTRMTLQSPDLPQILVGDFNMPPKEPGYAIASKSLYDIFGKPPFNRSSDDVTYHEYTGSLKKRWTKPILQWIDYIFITADVKVLNAKRIVEVKQNSDIKYASDHWHLFAELAF